MPDPLTTTSPPSPLGEANGIVFCWSTPYTRVWIGMTLPVGASGRTSIRASEAVQQANRLLARRGRIDCAAASEPD